MTLRLAHDSADVIPLEIYNFQNIAACARKFADQLEAGELGDPSHIVLVSVQPDGIALSLWGDNATGYEIMGILEAAKLRAHDANLIDDD
jgi:hypothetical protein